MAKPIPVFTDLQALAASVEQAFAAIDPQDADAGEILPVTPVPSLIGIDPRVYDQINGALQSGKRHLMFYGPPGTGKTTIAQYVAGVLNDEWRMITGSADWTSQDIIGGYQPVGNGQIRFTPGVLLQNFDRPFIIDELNRCDIDKVIGPLFTVLSDQPTTLPYGSDPADPDSPRYVLLPQPKNDPEDTEFAPGPRWRLIATINTVDKASLYQMSYALTRRFGWIFIDVPSDLAAFVTEFWTGSGGIVPGGAQPNTLALMWTAVNAVRKLGPAPFVDVIRFCATRDPQFNPIEQARPEWRNMYVDGIECFVAPMLDGILESEATTLADGLAEALSLPAQDGNRTRLTQRIRALSV